MGNILSESRRYCVSLSPVVLVLREGVGIEQLQSASASLIRRVVQNSMLAQGETRRIGSDVANNDETSKSTPRAKCHHLLPPELWS